MSKVLRWMGVVAVLLIPALGHAAEECNGFINISYPGSQPINSIGDVLTVRVDLGAGTITGGPLNVLLLQKMGFDLSCADPPGPTPNCASEGPVIAYDGDASIMTNCPGTLTSDNPGGGAAPSHITFTFAPIVSVPNGSPIPPGFCSFSFTETILAQSTNSTGVIEQVIGYDVAACDNGVLLSGGFQTGSVPVESPVTHFSCYQVTHGALKPKITLTSLADRFGAYGAPTLVQVHRLCAPANKDDGDPTAPTNPNHLAGYEFQSTANSLLAAGVSVTNQFGNFTVDVRGLDKLLVPTSKSLVAPPLPPLPPGTIRHFACHKLDNIQGPDLGTRVTTVEDQFSALAGITTIDGFTTKSRWRLCVAADKNGEEPDALTDTTALMCFWPKKTRFPTVDLFLNNQFGPGQFGTNIPRATQLDELCVPSTVVVP